jgi:hypothetical protein
MGKAQPGRWAILDGDGLVVGYLTGRFGGRIPEAGIEGAFISLIVVASGARKGGNGRSAIREFARRASAESRATIIGLRLDEIGDVDARRTSFERIGFEFAGLIGIAPVDKLLSGAGEPR